MDFSRTSSYLNFSRPQLFNINALPVHTLAQVYVGLFWGPRQLQEGPKTVPRRPKTAPRRPKTSQDVPKTAQEAPKMLPRWSKTPPRRPKTPWGRFRVCFGVHDGKHAGTKLTVVLTGNGEVGFDSRVGARETATTFDSGEEPEKQLPHQRKAAGAQTSQF